MFLRNSILFIHRKLDKVLNNVRKPCTGLSPSSSVLGSKSEASEGKSIWAKLLTRPEGEDKLGISINGARQWLGLNPLNISQSCVPGKNVLTVFNPHADLLCANFQIEVKVHLGMDQVISKIPRSVYASLDFGSLSLSESGGREDELQTLSVTSSELCPITLRSIKVAVKGQLCQHRQSFDAHSFLLLACESGSWCCPICGYQLS